MDHSILFLIALSTGFLTLLGCLLAGFIVLTEKKILNYGPCTIDINNGNKKLTVAGGSSLLSSLAEQSVFIPSACGGRGTCSFCKLKVESGGGVIGPVEESSLTPAEQKNNIRLSCQVKIRSDIRIHVPPELFSVKKFTGILERKQFLTKDMVELRIRLTAPETITFKAGQYLQLQSELYKGRESVTRAYSIASPPHDSGYVELIIRQVPEGICSNWAFSVVKEGQVVSFSGPYGDFFLSASASPLLFMAWGSGISPIWSMIRTLQKNSDTRRCLFFFGARTQSDLFFIDEFRLIEKEMPSFSFIPVLSREAVDSGWAGERGYTTTVFKKYISDTSAFEAYLCGGPAMIDSAIVELVKSGLKKEKIFYDKFS
ncbi:MAG: NADH:ubiquinone reductase (Na(+)-transporting) subunit F [Fibrobacterota bacterium]